VLHLTLVALSGVGIYAGILWLTEKERITGMIHMTRPG
jgi:hypothetical protein